MGKCGNRKYGHGFTSLPMWGVQFKGPITGSIKDNNYEFLLITTKNPKDSEATAELIDQLKVAIGHLDKMSYYDKQ